MNRIKKVFYVIHTSVHTTSVIIFLVHLFVCVHLLVQSACVLVMLFNSLAGQVYNPIIVTRSNKEVGWLRI